MAAFGGMYVVGGIKILYSTGLYSGGPAALWSSWVFTMVGASITAACLAEICSAIPLSGSIYLWAAGEYQSATVSRSASRLISRSTAAAGPKYGRLAGFIVAFWTSGKFSCHVNLLWIRR